MTAPLAIETLEKLQRRITLTLDAAGVAAQVEKKLKEKAKTARAAGFRPGKVPAKMVAAMYGAELESEAMGAQLMAQYADFVQTNDLKIAGYPQYSRVEAAPENSLQFHATFEVMPTIELDAINGLALEKIEVAISDADIERTLDNIRKQHAHFHPKGEDHAHGSGGEAIVAEGDQVVIDFVGTENGVPFDRGSANDFVFIVGDGQMLAEFDQALRGMRVAEKKSFQVTFPADYAAEMAGKTVDFEVTVKQISWRHLPDIDDAFAQQLGTTDLAALRADVQRNLELEIENRRLQQNKRKVLEQLIDAIKFDVPTQLVASEAQRMVERMQQEAQQQNSRVKLPQLQADIFHGAAERRVRMGLIVSELVEQNKLQATPDEVKAELDKMTSRYEQREQMREWYLKNPQELRNIEAVIVENKAIEFVFAKGKTTTVTKPMSELQAA